MSFTRSSVGRGVAIKIASVVVDVSGILTVLGGAIILDGSLVAVIINLLGAGEVGLVVSWPRVIFTR